MINNDKILVLAPHTDDGELGCGGTIAKFIESGKDVYYVAFSLCRKSLGEGLAPDTLEKEVKAATMVLGISQKNLHLYDYDVRNFYANRQEILEDMVRLKKEINPTLVLTPCSTDLHQDHQVIHNESLRAFKDVSIIGYELPWNNLSIKTNFFIKLEERHVMRKVEALKEYKSQSHRPYCNENFLRSLATARGVQTGAAFAEAYEVLKFIS
ncbi:MAG: PIG-L deacetylase family protein [Bacteroidota bacterium]